MEKRLPEISYKNGVRIFYFDNLSSTNDEARKDSYRHGDIIVGGVQSEGRGQRGNSWSSEAYANLTFSVVIEPCFLPAGLQFLLSEAVSLALTDTLNGFGLKSSIKWPNDIYIGDMKVAGILIENDIMGRNLSRSIVGIGLNVNQQNFDPSLPNPVSMKLAAGRSFELANVLENFYKNFRKRYEMLENGETDLLQNDYHDNLYLLDAPHNYRFPKGERFEGIMRQVRATGELIIERRDGTYRSFLFKEIEF